MIDLDNNCAGDREFEKTDSCDRTLKCPRAWSKPGRYARWGVLAFVLWRSVCAAGAFTDLTIDNTANQNINGSSPFVPSGTPSQLTWATIQSALGSGNVIVDTTTSPNDSQLGNITVAAGNTDGAGPGDLASAHQLTLQAAGSLNVNGAIVNSAAGNLVFNAQGGVTISAAIHVGGNVLVAGPSGITANNSVTSGGGQTYNNAVALGNDSTVTSSGVTFGSTVNGAHALAVTGNGTFSSAVGNTASLTSMPLTF